MSESTFRKIVPKNITRPKKRTDICPFCCKLKKLLEQHHISNEKRDQFVSNVKDLQMNQLFEQPTTQQITQPTKQTKQQHNK